MRNNSSSIWKSSFNSIKKTLTALVNEWCSDIFLHCFYVVLIISINENITNIHGGTKLIVNDPSFASLNWIIIKNFYTHTHTHTQRHTQFFREQSIKHLPVYCLRDIWWVESDKVIWVENCPMFGIVRFVGKSALTMFQSFS